VTVGKDAVDNLRGAMMRLTKLGHSCVRLEQGDTTLVLDPGQLTEPEALDGADAVLISHEHFDHLDTDRVRAAARANPRLQIWTNRSVAGQLADLGASVHTVGQGDAFEIGGVQVQVYGEWHAVGHPDIPRVQNVGFLLDGAIFHPGDSFVVPEAWSAATLLVPTDAPWMRVGDMIDYVRELAPRRAYSIHDGFLNDAGLRLVDQGLAFLAQEHGGEYRRLKPGEGVDLD
jgi:L-ascorbate metabolism protein UlaG (beta-lactamase superfamily)